MAGLLVTPAYDPTQPAVDPWAGVGASLAANVPAPAPAPDPQAGVAALLATPETQLKSYVKAHAATSALRLLGATLSDAGAGLAGRQGGAFDSQVANLQGLAEQPLQLAQAKARISGLMQAYASAGPEMKALILTDPEKAMATLSKNQELQKLGTNDVLGNANGQVGAPVPSVTPFTGTQGGILDTAGGGFRGVSAPVSAPPGTTVVPFTPGVAGGPSMGVGGPASGAVSPTAPALATPSAALSGLLGADGKLDPAKFYQGRILKYEGGLNPADMNGSPTMYGFNQKANMDINVKKLTPQSATARYVSKYWPQSGSANIADPGLAAINADTSFINPTKAAQILQQSGGDPAQYMALRRQWMAQMVQTNPRAEKYAKAWDSRNNDLAALAGIGGAAAGPALSPGAAVAPSPAAAAPSGPGFGAPIVQGKTAQTLSPQEAQSMGLAPGVWQRDPTGKLSQVSETPAGDLKRLDSLTSTADMLRGLVNEQTQFLKHNNNVATGAPLADINVAGHEFDNPITGLMARSNPDMQAMEGSHARQTFMVKPPASGRVMQSEIPYWAAQAQSPGNGGDVNTGILRDNAQRLQTVTAEAKFYQDYLYQHGNSQGFETAWANQQRQAAGQGAPGPSAVPTHPQGISPEDAAKLPKGTPFVTLDGRHMVRQ